MVASKEMMSTYNNAGCVIPRNTGLMQLIRAKREWHWKPSISELRQGFRGWFQRGYLPHFDAPGVTQMVTFMLEDSFPVRRRAEWEPIFKEANDSKKRRMIEAWLDRGYGKCWLRQPEIADHVEKVILVNNGRDFLMQAWCVMPNHLHLVLDVWQIPLSKLIGTWKGKSSRIANTVLNRQGHFWQADYFDTLIRDEAHLARAIRYTENNPPKARLAKDKRDWPWSSARRRDEYGRLTLSCGGR
jgi:putative DNA methylase